MALEKVLYNARATSTGGRSGNSESSDGALKVTLSTPKELGGAGGPGTNPEQTSLQATRRASSAR